jgi:Flp pilus assembly protein TadB
MRIKRFAFVPLLALLCLLVGFTVAANDKVWAVAATVLLFVLIAPLWDRRRRRRYQR